MNKLFSIFGAAALLATASIATAAPVVLDDFSALAASNHPGLAPVAGTWYDSTESAFSTIVAGANGGAQLGDGGFTNGSYAEMDETIPTTGDYTVTLEVTEIVEAAGSLNGIRGIEVGVVLNGFHRPDGAGSINAANPSLDAVGASSLTFDTADNSAGDGTTVLDTITTAQFSATAGDSIFIIIAVDADDVSQSGAWGTGASYTVANLTLVDVTSDVTDWNLY